MCGQHFRQAGFVPNVLFETSRAKTIIDIIAARMCCGLVPYTDSIPPRKEVAFFCLPGHPTWNLAASYRKNSYLSMPARHFIELASAYWKEELAPPHMDTSASSGQ